MDCMTATEMRQMTEIDLKLTWEDAKRRIQELEKYRETVENYLENRLKQEESDGTMTAFYAAKYGCSEV